VDFGAFYTNKGNEILLDCSGGCVVMSSSTPFNNKRGVGVDCRQNPRMIFIQYLANIMVLHSSISATYLKSSEDKASS
jgi:hypothetical protein